MYIQTVTPLMMLNFNNQNILNRKKLMILRLYNRFFLLKRVIEPLDRHLALDSENLDR